MSKNIKTEKIQKSTTMNNLVYLLNRLYNLADTFEIDNSNCIIICTNVSTNSSMNPFTQIKARMQMGQYRQIRKHDIIKISELINIINCFNLDVVHNNTVTKSLNTIRSNVNLVLNYNKSKMFENQCHVSAQHIKDDLNKLVDKINPKYSYSITKSMN